MVILEFTEHVCNIFELTKLILLPINNNDSYHESSRYTREMTYR